MGSIVANKNCMLNTCNENQDLVMHYDSIANYGALLCTWSSAPQATDLFVNDPLHHQATLMYSGISLLWTI